MNKKYRVLSSVLLLGPITTKELYAHLEKTYKDTVWTYAGISDMLKRMRRFGLVGAKAYTLRKPSYQVPPGMTLTYEITDKGKMRLGIWKKQAQKIADEAGGGKK